MARNQSPAGQKYMKTVGIIGGFGPETTAAFQLAIVELFRAQNCKTRPPILMLNTPIPIKIEDELVLHGKGLRNFLPFLIDATCKLEKSGVDFLVLPCNTLHLLADEMVQHIHIPMLNIVEETAKELQKNKIKQIGLLANQTSIQNKLHSRVFDKSGIQSVLPTTQQQTIINRIIHNLLLNRHVNTASQKLTEIILSLKKQGVNNVLLGCTDLQLILPTVKGVTIHDSMNILAQATVRKMLGGSL